MVMVCYLDDSDAQQSSVATLAGYVATERNWSIIEAHLRHVCESYGVAVLHAKEFHDTKGDFKGWSRSKKTKFVDDLYTPARRITWGVEFSGGKDWREKKAPFPAHQRTSLYGVLFSAIMFRLVNENPLAKVFEQEGLAFLVETGHNNNDEIAEHFEKVKNFEAFRGICKSIQFIDKGSCRAIQLADFLAFHARRFAALRASTGTGDTAKYAPILHQIHSKVPHLATVVPQMQISRVGTFEDYDQLRQKGLV